MKNIKYIIFQLFLSILLVSCSQDKFDEIDTDPNNITSVGVDNVLPSAQVKYFCSMCGSTTATAISTYVEHSCNVHAEAMEVNRKTGLFSTAYGTLRDTKEIIEQGTAEESWIHVGIAQVIQAFALGMLTDCFGEVPWTEALLGSDNRNPVYDTQESIYDDLFDMLDNAIVNLSKSAADPGENDLLLGGDTDMWTKVAWGLKARYYNRLSNIDASGSATNALEAAANSFSSQEEGLIFSDFQDATTYCNPISAEENSMKRFSASVTILNVINSFNVEGYDDPRAELWFDKIGGEFIGAPNGENEEDTGKSKYSAISTSNVLYLAAPMPLLMYEEIKFIEAEANLRIGNRQAANEAYKEAVKVACSRAGLSDTEITDYTSQGSVFSADVDLTLEMIIKQKFLSFFMMQPIEAYNDYRRTSIPSLYNTQDGIPERIVYPDSEYATNTNTPSDIDLVTIYTEKVWWAK